MSERRDTPKWHSFNVNNYVRVKLNPDGFAILKSKHDELRKHFPKLPPWKPPAVDQEGWTNYQLWSLMSDFGPHIGMGAELPFQIEIQFPVQP